MRLENKRKRIFIVSFVPFFTVGLLVFFFLVPNMKVRQVFSEGILSNDVNLEREKVFTGKITNGFSKRPNIIFILVDDMGWSDIGSFGSEIETPNLDSLAYEGIRFTNFYNTSKCFPTRALLLTGIYAQQNGAFSSSNSFYHNAVTLAEILGPSGYDTIMVGKNHSLVNPYDRGFDHAYGTLNGGVNYFNPGLQRSGEVAPVYKVPFRYWIDDVNVFRTDDPSQQDYFADPEFYATDHFTDKAIEYLEEAQYNDDPFFLYLAYTAPHNPIQAWITDTKKYTDTYKVGYEAIRNARYLKMLDEGVIDVLTHSLSPPDYVAWSSLSLSQQRDEALRMAVYAAMIDRVDQNVGRLLDTLDELGERENTIIMFASDNGASTDHSQIGSGEIGDIDNFDSVGSDWANVSNTPFRGYKEGSYEGGIISPLIFYWGNGVTNPNRISHRPIHLIDVMTTILDITGFNYPRTYNGDAITPAEGESFLTAILDMPQSNRPPMFWDFRGWRVIRDGQWKLVGPPDSAWELYDLATDATELNNLASTYPVTTSIMAADFDAWKKRVSTIRIPIVVDDQYNLSLISTATVITGVFDVLSNDSDYRGTPITPTLQQPPNWGIASFNNSHQLNYTYTYTYSDTVPFIDTLTYYVTGIDGDFSYESIVSMFVDHPHLPLAKPDTASILFNDGVYIDVVENDIDNDGLLVRETIQIVTPPQYGFAEVVDGMILYTHKEDHSLLDTFSYKLQDDAGNWSNVASVRIQIQNIFQAEDATTSGASFELQNGSTGAGYVDLRFQNGFVEWSIDVLKGGIYDLEWRYTRNFTTPHTLALQINGVVITNSLLFEAPIETWLWDRVKYSVGLQPGNNLIRLINVSDDLDVQLDFLNVSQHTDNLEFVLFPIIVVQDVRPSNGTFFTFANDPN